MSGLGEFIHGLVAGGGAPACPEPPVVTPTASTSTAPAQSKVLRYDLSGEPHALSRNEWTASKRRDPSKMRGIVLHQWATPVGTTPGDRQLYGEPLALARRGLAVPYTITCGVTRHGGRPVAAQVHPVERYTFASDQACGEWLAIGVMGRFPFVEAERSPLRHTAATDLLAAALDEALAMAVEMLHGADHPLGLITHRQAINGRGDHEVCPGEAVVAMACRSCVVRDGLLVPDPDLVLVPKWGKPWPPEWRRHLARVTAGGVTVT